MCRRLSGSRREPANRAGAIPATRVTSGLAHAPFTPFRTESKGEPRTTGSPRATPGLSLDDKAITPERLAGRRSLLGQLDDFCRKLHHDEAMLGMDSFTQRAFEVLSSRRVFEALDLTKEDPRPARAGTASAT